MRRWIPRMAYSRPVTVFTFFVAILVLGLLSWQRIPLQMLPSGFEPRSMWVWIPYGNASPAEIDEQIVRPIEDQFSTVSGLKEVRSTARSDAATFSLSFYNSVEMSDAYNDVVDRIERAMPDMPEDIDKYYVFKYNPDDAAIMWAGVSISEDVEDPYQLMTTIIQPRLERIPGVASIDIWGANSRRAIVYYDRDKLTQHGVGLGQVQRSLRTDNFQMSGGQVEERGQVKNIRSLARIDDLEVFEQYPIRADGLELGDIAEIGVGMVASADINRIGGNPGAALAIKKESSANTVEVSQAIGEAIAELQRDPRTRGAEFFVFFDQGELIASSNQTLLETAMTGGLFSVLVLWLFLREWRMTLLIAASIPFSMLITVAVMYFRGDTMNLVAMMGLMLAVGMVVDNAIVVVESIYRRRADGLSSIEAAVEGSSEVNLAILASTATTMVVFLPVILMSEGVEASFFLSVLGLPVVFALGASLLVALVFAPLATRYISGGEIKADPVWLQWITGRYNALLDRVLRFPLDASMGLLAMTLLTLFVAVPGVGCSDEGGGGVNDFTIRFTVPPNATYSERDEIVRTFETLVESHREEWGVRVYRVEQDDRSTRGRLSVYLDSEASMPRAEVMDAAKKLLPTEIPGVEASIGWQGGSGDKQLRLQIFGEETAVLESLGEEVVRRVLTVDGVLSAELETLSDGLDELRLQVNRDAALRYGVSAAEVGQNVAFAMRAQSLEPIQLDGWELDVETRLEPDDRDDIATVLDFPIWAPEVQRIVPVRSLTNVGFGKGAGRIRREDRRAGTTVTVELEDDVTKRDALPAIQGALANLSLPRGYSWSAGRFERDQGEEDAAMYFAFFLSVSFVFLLMGVLFESWVLPMAVIVTIPMAGVGAFWGLYLTGTGLDMMAVIGLIVLVGVVVNNGIVLVDLITQLRSEGLERLSALKEGCSRRLRPILMTAATTIFGLVPMAMGTTDFVGIPYAPLGRTVIGGLLASTVLTLIFVPWLYVLLDDMRLSASTWFGVYGSRRAS